MWASVIIGGLLSKSASAGAILVVGPRRSIRCVFERKSHCVFE
jgi:hypothetical protein